MSESISHRTCKKCGNSFPLTVEFWYKDKSAAHGLGYRCKPCAKSRSREWHYDNQELANERSRERYRTHPDEVRAYRAENAEHIAQTKREWRQNNPELVAAQKKRSYERCKTHIQEYQKRWRAKNRKRLLEEGRIYYRENAAKICARSSAWAKANPDRMLNYFHKRRALIAGNGGDGFTKADKNLQLRSQKGLCWWCSKPMGLDITIDHIIALKRGGKHDPRNIVLAHHSCNCSKQDKLPQDWCGRLF